MICRKAVLSRTQPSPIDLAIALAGGLAAAFALAMPNISAASTRCCHRYRFDAAALHRGDWPGLPALGCGGWGFLAFQHQRGHNCFCGHVGLLCVGLHPARCAKNGYPAGFATQSGGLRHRDSLDVGTADIFECSVCTGCCSESRRYKTEWIKPSASLPRKWRASRIANW